jgi:hypothetical protein
MNPFDEEFLATVSSDGMSSADIQRRIKMLTERTQFLFEINKELQEEIIKLKDVTPPTRRKKTA